MCQTAIKLCNLFQPASQQKHAQGKSHLCAHFGASVVSRSSEYLEAQCCEEPKESQEQLCDRRKWNVVNLLHRSWIWSLCSAVERAWIMSYLLREPVRRSPRFCKWFNGSTDRYPVRMNTIQDEIHTKDSECKTTYYFRPGFFFFFVIVTLL